MSEKKIKSLFKVGDKVRIVSAPIVENNPYGQSQIDNTVGKIGKVDRVAKNASVPIRLFTRRSPSNLTTLKPKQ